MNAPMLCMIILAVFYLSAVRGNDKAEKHDLFANDPQKYYRALPAKIDKLLFLCSPPRPRLKLDILLAAVCQIGIICTLISAALARISTGISYDRLPWIFVHTACFFLVSTIIMKGVLLFRSTGVMGEKIVSIVVISAGSMFNLIIIIRTVLLIFGCIVMQ